MVVELNPIGNRMPPPPRKREQGARQYYGLAVGEVLNQRARSIPSDSQSAVAFQLSKQSATAALDYGRFL